MFDINNFEKILKFKLNKVNKRKLMFLCIGTNENIVDSIGPRIGTILESSLGNEKVLGSEKYNINNKLKLIRNYHKLKGKKIVSIDAAISEIRLEDKIFISDGPVIMGSALGLNRGIIGDYSIKLVFNSLNFNNVNFINYLSQMVSNSILRALNYSIK